MGQEWLPRPSFPLGLCFVVLSPETKSGQLCFNSIESEEVTSTVKEVLVLVPVSSSLEFVSRFCIPLSIKKRKKEEFL